MVIQFSRAVAGSIAILLGQSPVAPLMRLPPAARAKLIGALILLTIGGLALIVLSWLALRMGRRHLKRVDERASMQARPASGEEWAAKPLVTRTGADPDADET